MTNTRLTFDDAVTIWLRRWLGDEKQRIIIDLQQNAIRIYEIWEEKTFKGSREVAKRIFEEKYPHIVAKTDFSPHRPSRRLVPRRDDPPGEQQGSLF